MFMYLYTFILGKNMKEMFVSDIVRNNLHFIHTHVILYHIIHFNIHTSEYFLLGY
jgi:hypothetical protein